MANTQTKADKQPKPRKQTITFEPSEADARTLARLVEDMQGVVSKSALARLAFARGLVELVKVVPAQAASLEPLFETLRELGAKPIVEKDMDEAEAEASSMCVTHTTEPETGTSTTTLFKTEEEPPERLEDRPTPVPEAEPEVEPEPDGLEADVQAMLDALD